MRIWRLCTAALTAVLALGGWSAASAGTFLMPDRDMLMGTSEVVWGITTQANGTAFVLDYGDGSAQSTGTVADRSFIAFNHTYALSGTFTATLCVGAGAAVPGCPGEQATVVVKVYNGGLLSAYDLRNLNINRAIENGFRYLWTSQTNRTNFDTTDTTNWVADYPLTAASLAVLSFENHNYKVPNNNNTPTGLYERFLVQRGLNYIFSNLAAQPLNVQGSAVAPDTLRDPCVGPGIEAAPCTGYRANADSYLGYSTATAALAIAGSGTPARMAGNFGPVNGKAYAEILQRVVDAMAWGQIDGVGCVGRGGWHYQLFNNGCDSSDGSTAGWNILAMLDSQAAGATIPAFVKTEFATYAFPNGFNVGGVAGNDGTFDYNSDGNSASGNRNLGKTGIGMQGLFWTGAPFADPRVASALGAINLRWPTGSTSGDDGWVCGAHAGEGCAYPMFNVFKALKLYGVQTLAASTRAAGPGPIPAGDWYAEYVDYLLTNQVSPTVTTGGSWNFSFSCCGLNGYPPVSTAISELILAPVALVQPDPTLFSSVGLKQGVPLSTADDTNPVSTQHTVTAQVRGTGGVPVPGATVNFSVLSGPNAPKTTGDGVCLPAGCVTPASGDVTWTYTGGPNPGTDVIRANIGNLLSNTLNKIWIVPVNKCDVDLDGKVTQTDLAAIRAANGATASGPNDPRDGNSDGVINVADWRYCQLRLTPQ